MNYSEVRAILESASGLGSRPGLHNIGRLCALLEDPQDKLKFIHVAGTNGKGSVCAMIAGVVKAAGYKTGMYLSPYLEDYTDSFYINGKKVSKPDFARILTIVNEKAQIMAGEGSPPTEFEILTVCAFLLFLQKGCDYVILETGMGGDLDATNIIKTTLVSVITAISIDHTAFLGGSVEEIVWHKCGIIKKGGITVCYPDQKPSVINIVKETSENKKNILYVPDMNALAVKSTGLEGTHIRYQGLDINIPIPGRHQALNAITSIETVNALRERYGLDITDENIVMGISEAYLPARQEVLLKKPLVILDGSHNIQGIEALADTLRKNLKGRSITVIMGMLKDKQYEQAIAMMASFADKFIAVKPDNPRALDPGETAEIAQRYCAGSFACDDFREAVKSAAEFSGNGGAIVICGSLYLAAKMRRAVENTFGKQ